MCMRCTERLEEGKYCEGLLLKTAGDRWLLIKTIEITLFPFLESCCCVGAIYKKPERMELREG